MRNRRLVRIRPGGVRIVYPPLWPALQEGCGAIGKTLSRLHNHMLRLRAAEMRP